MNISLMQSYIWIFLPKNGTFKLYPYHPTLSTTSLFTSQLNTHIKWKFHEIMFTLFHSSEIWEIPTSTTRFSFYDLDLNPPFPPLKFMTLKTKNQEVEWHRANSIQLGGFLFIDVPPTSPPNVNAFHLPPKKKVVKGKIIGVLSPVGS